MTLSVDTKKALLFIAHGSRLAEANLAVEALARLVQAAVSDRVVRAVFLDCAAPSIPDGIDWAVGGGAEAIELWPYFLVPGRHVVEDIARLIDEAKLRHPGVSFALLPHLGEDPEFRKWLIQRFTAR